LPVIFRRIRPKAPEPARFNWHPLQKPLPVPVIFRRIRPNRPESAQYNWHLVAKTGAGASYPPGPRSESTRIPAQTQRKRAGTPSATRLSSEVQIFEKKNPNSPGECRQMC
jgi:hypothetical protein